MTSFINNPKVIFFIPKKPQLPSLANSHKSQKRKTASIVPKYLIESHYIEIYVYFHFVRFSLREPLTNIFSHVFAALSLLRVYVYDIMEIETCLYECCIK